MSFLFRRKKINPDPSTAVGEEVKGITAELRSMAAAMVEISVKLDRIASTRLKLDAVQ